MSRAALAALLLLCGVPATAQTIAIQGGTLALGDGSEPIQGGTVVIRDGRIVAAGLNVNVPSGAHVIDATGKWVTPGLVAGYSQLGLIEIELGDQGAQDQAANGPFNAALDIAPAINPHVPAMAINRADGVTRAIVSPSTGNNIFGGQGALIDTGSDFDSVTRARLFQFVELGEAGAANAGGSRPSAYVLFRSALREAAELSRYSSRRGEVAGRTEPRERADPDRPIETRLLGPDARRSEDIRLTRFDAAALVPVLEGRQYLLVHVERASDILQVIKLKRDFPRLRPVLVGASEGWMVADTIAAAAVPVIASALNDLPSSFEQKAATQSNIGRMRAAGVEVGIGMINDNENRHLFHARQYAGNLVALGKVPGATGVSWGEALAMLTSGPAKAFGLGDQVGSLKAGNRGDAVIWSGDPLELSSVPEAVWIDGVPQPLDTRQTKLRNRYLDLERRDLPEAYRR